MAAPTPVASAEALVSAIQKSGLLAGDALAKLREVAAKSPEPKQLARDLVRTGTLTRWQAEQLLYGFHRLIIGKYKLLDQLGTAPTGRLYLAEHAQMGRRHTIKVLAKRLAANPEAVKQFLAAAQTACGLDHRNISHVYDVIQDHERHSHYVVMEYVEGIDLDTLVQREGRLAPLEAIDFLIQAAEGLSHAHAGGVVHGDLKPSNLLLDQTGTIKILEIGQAGTGATPQTDPVDESIEMAALGAVVFQPPELRGEARVPEVSADVYSLGSVLAFLLTGQASIDAETAITRLKEQAELPPELIELCGRMMAENPGERPQSMGRVLEQLAPIVRQFVAATKRSQHDDLARRPVIEVTDQPAVESPSKVAKHPVAKSIAADAPVEIVIPGVTQPVVEVAPPEAPVIQTRGRVVKKPPVAKAVKPDDGSADSGPTAVVVTAPAAAAYGPVVVYSAIGSGIVLVLALVIAVVCFWLAGRKDNGTTNAPAAAVAPAEIKTETGEANPSVPVAESDPESNPVPAVDLPTTGGTVEIAEQAKPVDSPATASIAATAEAATPAGTKEPVNEKSEAPLAASPAAEPPAVKPKPTGTETKSPPKATAKPAPAAPKTPAKFEPFKGLAAAVSLPALADAAGQPVSARPGPAVLGPCKVLDDRPLSAELLGGEGAVRGTKHKFELQAKADQPRVWEAVLTGVSSPITIGTFTVGAGNLLFEWTDEALKQAAVAKQLCNCTLKLTAADTQHALSLRKPVMGAPVVVDIEKPGSTKWNIGDLPVGKQVFVEVTRVEGLKDSLAEPKQVASGDLLTVWLGETSKSLPLGIKLDTSSTARDVEIKLQPMIKLEDQEPRVYRRKELLALHQKSMLQLEFLGPELKKTKDSRPTRDVEKLLKEQKIEALGKQQLVLSKTLEQINFATGFAEKFAGSVQVHFRVYFQSGETKVDLLRTEETPAVRK